MHSAGPIVKDIERRIERIYGQETALVECAGCTQAPQSRPKAPWLGGWHESSHVPIGEVPRLAKASARSLSTLGPAAAKGRTVADW
jgi:hypothetical protein